MHDQKKAEKFGRLMLKDGSSKNPQANPEAADEDDDNFEEVDLDEVVSPKNTHQPNLTEYDRTDDELYEEHSLGGASSESEVNKRSQKSLAKQAERLMKLELYAPGDSGAEEEVI